MHDWLNMGGYGFFVWGSYGTAILGLIFLSLWVGLAHARASRNADKDKPAA